MERGECIELFKIINPSIFRRVQSPHRQNYVCSRMLVVVVFRVYCELSSHHLGLGRLDCLLQVNPRICTPLAEVVPVYNQ